MINFNFQNVVAHSVSTVLGTLLAVGLLLLVKLKVCTFADVSPLLLVVVPFLLYGRRPPGSTPAFDSTAAPELQATGAPGANG